MTLKVKIFIITILFLVLIGIIYLVRRRKLDLKYVLAWLGCDVALLILTLFPQLMGVIASLLGIQSPINTIFFLGFLFSLIIIFSLTVALSRVTGRVRRMAQQIAMLEFETKYTGDSSK